MNGTAPVVADARPTVVASAPAKTNLALHVGSPTPDGYHPLETLFLAVDLRETVTATLDPSLARRGTGVSVSVQPEPGSAYERMVEEGTARLSDIPVDESNLAVRAALAVCAALGVPAPGLRLHIRKAVPVAGGMGGGSADAAAALVAVNELLTSHLGLPRLTPEDLHRIGAGLGADVPFMLLGGAAIGRGTGTELTPVPAPVPVHVVFVPQDQGLSTPEVYRRWDAAHTVVNAAAAQAVGDDAGSVPRTLDAPAPGDESSASAFPDRSTSAPEDDDAAEPRWEQTAAIAAYPAPDPEQTARLAPVHTPASPGSPGRASGPDAPHREDPAFPPDPGGAKSSNAPAASSVTAARPSPGTDPDPARDSETDTGPAATAGAAETGVAPDPVPEDLLDALRRGDTARLAALVRNDLQAPAIRLLPELETLLDHGVDLGAVVGWVSGSGPTLCFLTGSEAAADALVAAFDREQRRALAVTAPAPGARVEPAG